MKRWLCLAIAVMVVTVMSQPLFAHHHPRPLPSPWTDRRPVVKIKSKKHSRRQLRPYFYWQEPSYLETAPVVFPGPAPLLPPLFAPARP